MILKSTQDVTDRFVAAGLRLRDRAERENWDDETYGYKLGKLFRIYSNEERIVEIDERIKTAETL